MTPLIVIGLLAGLPIVLLILLRSNAAVVFLALCTGSVVQQFLGSDTAKIFNASISGNNSTTASGVQLALLLLPALLTAVFLRKSVNGAKMLFNIIPAVSTGVVTALLAVPLLSPGLRYSITGTAVWIGLEQFQAVIVGAAVFMSLLILWSSHLKGSFGKHKKH